MIQLNSRIVVCEFCEGYGFVKVIEDTKEGTIITIEKCHKKCINGFFR